MFDTKRLKREVLLTQTLEVELDLESNDSPKQLLSEAQSLINSLGKYGLVEKRLYEIYFILAKSYPKILVEIGHPVFFHTALYCIEDYSVLRLISDNDESVNFRAI